MRIIKDNFNKGYGSDTIKRVTKHSNYLDEDFTYGVLEIVELRNGMRAFIFDDRLLTKNGYIMLSHYKGNNHKSSLRYDIVGRKEIKSTKFTNMENFIDYLKKEINYE